MNRDWMAKERNIRARLHEDFKRRYGRYQRWFSDGNDHWQFRQRDWLEEKPVVESLWGDWLDEIKVQFGDRSRV